MWERGSQVASPHFWTRLSVQQNQGSQAQVFLVVFTHKAIRMKPTVPFGPQWPNADPDPIPSPSSSHLYPVSRRTARQQHSSSSAAMNMNFACHCSSTFPRLVCSLPLQARPFGAVTATISPPARDRVIDFGKYKARMLGSLPSTYLKWVSKNLRAGDFERWAKMVDTVLQDPVYQDRLEWEFADGVLNGNKTGFSKSVHEDEGGGAASQLLEISERFGWDNEDKVGWSQVNFELLGTSKSGRIPRQLLQQPSPSPSSSSSTTTTTCGGGTSSVGGGKGKVLSESESGGGSRRRERRERGRMKREMEAEKGRMGITGKSRQGTSANGNSGDEEREEDTRTKIYNNPFPGREAMLKNAFINRKRFS